MMSNGTLNRICVVWILAGLFVSVAGHAEAAAEVNSDDAGPVCILPIRSDINPGTSGFVRRAVAEAEARGARVLVVDINTFGGRVDSATEIRDALISTSVETIAFVNPRAISAGALIALACKSIVMAPASTIGAATPVMIGPGMAQPQPTSEKEVSYMRTEFRSTAEHNGYPPLLAEAMVDPDVAVGVRFGENGAELFKVDAPAPVREEKAQPAPAAPGLPIKLPGFVPQESIGGNMWAAISITELDPKNIVTNRGKLLTLSKEEALDWGLTSLSADSLTEALALFDIHDATLVRIEMSWSEKLAGFLTNPVLAGLLLTFGFLGVLYELKMPGWGVSGTFGIVCLSLFFGAHYLTGMANWFEVVLFIVGVVLLAAEIFVIPGFGIAGVSGILCLLLSLYMSLVKQPIPQYAWDVDAAYRAAWTLGIWAVSFVVAVVLSWKVLEKTPLYAAIVQVHEERAEAGFTMPTAGLRDLVGRRGVALSILRPTGRARFDDKKISVVTEGEFMPKGAKIRVVEVEGNRIVVAQDDQIESDDRRESERT
jgi:membrane-bound serine protease (ClpP class)